MNLSKAREYFSAFYEGSLDRGLREGFERALKTDAQIQAEYKAFERTMMQLDAMKATDVEPPTDLHDLIMARIDKNVWDQKQKRNPVLSWWKSAIAVGVAATVIAIGVLQSGKGTAANEAGLTMPSNASLDVRAGEKSVFLDYAPNGHHQVIIKSDDGKVLESLDLNGKPIRDKVLRNATKVAIMMSVEIDKSPTWIALPGTDRSNRSAGKGTIKDLALEIANACNVPVVLKVKDIDAETSWKLDSTDAHATAMSAVSAMSKQVELRGKVGDAQTLWILDN